MGLQVLSETGVLRLKKPDAAEMTVEQFADELRRIREKAWHIPSAAPSRQDRSYSKQKRGDFFGKGDKA